MLCCIRAFLCLNLQSSIAGVTQLSEWSAFLDQPRSAFIFLLCQPVQGLPAPKEQGCCWRHVVGDPQRAQHLHGVPAQQSLPPSHAEGQRGTSDRLTVCHEQRPTTALTHTPSSPYAGPSALLAEHVPPPALRQVAVCSPGRGRLHSREQRLLFWHCLQVRKAARRSFYPLSSAPAESCMFFIIADECQGQVCSFNCNVLLWQAAKLPLWESLCRDLHSSLHRLFLTLNWIHLLFCIFTLYSLFMLSNGVSCTSWLVWYLI